MKEFIAQIRNKWFHPSSQQDLDLASESYRENQLVRIKSYAIGKSMEPSVIQNNLLHACFEVVASTHPQLNTKAKVKFATKVELNYVHEDRIAVRKDGTVQFEYRSFSFKELKNMERLRIFERSFECLAGLLGITVDELIAEAKARMGERR